MTRTDRAISVTHVSDVDCYPCSGLHMGLGRGFAEPTERSCEGRVHRFVLERVQRGGSSQDIADTFAMVLRET